ncbi:hypothetical protein HR45_05560 [Shewanella mangrovi]|uniref:DUF3224 domain-containing protein n=1 Tax=Shewanella mangrovi TaxID=1515746 RepID=A0A094JIV3_9GAMM|nr:DUF3224 domain-containing protein [Shewanella mangrovi]KFZ37979.1 hypothetical protein HR45_05560 [Shewanella mangrovi]
MDGTFQITEWDENAYNDSGDGVKKSHAKIKQQYSGAIIGASELQYLMSYQSATTAVFVGFEVVNGVIDGKSGTITLQHNGKFENGVASSEFSIVTGSGTGELAGVEGNGSFRSGAAGQASYQLTLTA